MKPYPIKLILALISFALLSVDLGASELTFEVVFESNARWERDYQLRFFLLAFDTFHAAVRDGAVKWHEGDADKEVKLPPSRLVCETEPKVLRVIFESEPSGPDRQAIAEALSRAVSVKNIMRKFELLAELKAKLEAMRRQVESEPIGPRRQILEALLEANSPMEYGGPPSPFPLRLRKNG